MTRIAITGHASLDHVAHLDGVPAPGRTTTILERPAGAWPRLGGSPAYVAGALVQAGIAGACPVSWIGDDEDGREYRRQLRDRGIGDDGIEAVAGARTPIALLAYEPGGGCICLYDPGMAQDIALSQRQRALVAGAEWVCVTIGPASVSEAVLAAIGGAARLAWVVKDDPRSMPLPLAARLAARADLITFSEAEGAFVRRAIEAAEKEPRPGRMLIETRGRRGAAFTCEGKNESFAAAPLAVDDPTGAGDSFAGGVLAALLKGVTDAAAIVGAGHEAARRLLAGRQRPAATESA